MKTRRLAMNCMLVLAGMTLGEAIADDLSPYRVAAGSKVDKATLGGWRTWRALACERCHGAQQEGLVGPSLLDSLKHLSRAQFEDTVLKGRVEKGMPNFGESKMVIDNLQGLYAYLKGRSDGAIQPGRLEELNPGRPEISATP